AGEALSGTYASQGETGSINLEYQADLAEPASLAGLAGSWTRPGAQAVTAEVAADGTFSFSRADGCLGEGSFAVIDPAWSIYQVELTLKSCGSKNGAWSGLGTLDGKQAEGDVLWFMVANQAGTFMEGWQRD
ncbi:MAG: hypothetical protein C0616_03255, partial [Desulfuromonas sp.]